ncbi:MAG: hypothetical protein EA350_15640 [Gemmatimonadales bacterium]|nr:MAG: hypothetical protein EA350_15640 [Gemmatimonadales bacterium]
MHYVRTAFTIVALVVITAFISDTPVPGYEAEAIPRGVYFKLPLEQPRFHWRFTDQEAFLSGRLALSITSSDGQRQEFVVFEDGAITDGWREISGPQADGSMYFGFSSRLGALTASRDSIEVELIVLEDLAGMGAFNEGVLPAGRYVASASYSSLTGKRWYDWITRDNRDPMAFISCWHHTWPLEITRNQGWHGAQEADQDPSGSSWFSNVLDATDVKRGTDGTRCLK